MNLFYQPTLSELSALLKDVEITDHEEKINVIVDNDGEVLIDVNNSLPENQLFKFKFHFKGLQSLKDDGLRKRNNLKIINQLFKNLVFCWEKGLSGAVDFQIISLVRKMLYEKELRFTHKRDYPIRLNA